MLGDAPYLATPHPGPRSREILDRLRDSEAAPGLTRGLSLEPPVLARAEGAVIEDPDGNRFLDMVAGFGSLNLGHSHPAVVEAATRQLALGQSLAGAAERQRRSIQARADALVALWNRRQASVLPIEIDISPPPVQHPR